MAQQGARFGAVAAAVLARLRVGRLLVAVPAGE
jgi:hypothetical protein